MKLFFARKYAIVYSEYLSDFQKEPQGEEFQPNYKERR